MNGKEEECQGWKKYETSEVAVWIDNDSGLLEYVHDLGRENKDNAAFADAIKELIEDMVPELEVSLFSVLLSSAIGEIDWYELADAYLKEIAEIDEYDEEMKKRK